MTCTLAICIAAGAFSVTDGDTIRAGDLRLRLWGIDAPERSEPLGPASAEAMRRLTAGAGLACDFVELDRYGRSVARCDLWGGPLDGHDLACLMVAGGWAEDWPRYSGGAYRECGR